MMRSRNSVRKMLYDALWPHMCMGASLQSALPYGVVVQCHQLLLDVAGVLNIVLPAHAVMC
jgi:hypothetical protein